MAAYAALVSLMNLLEQLQRHPRPPITLESDQVQTLTQKIAFLQHFLEDYNSHYSKPEMEHLRNHITDAAYDAEDVIEAHIVNRIRAPSRSYDEDAITASSRHIFCCFLSTKRPTADALTICNEENVGSVDLHKVIRDMSFVEKEVLEIKDMLGTQDSPRSFGTNVVASKSTTTEHNIMVGFDDVLIEMLDKLTGQPDSHREIIPISGMGGIGKTTLTRNVYINPLIEYHFDIRAWITFSQEYNVRDILLGALLKQKNQENLENISEMSDAQIGERLYKSLCGRRYLIVIDDMWSHAAWDRVKRFFPNQCNGSRIIITTRLTNMASNFTTNCCGVEMGFLDQDKSWSLFCQTVFRAEDSCPSELEHIGKEISGNCKGLPLSIVVIGGLLAKSRRTHEYWKYVSDNLNSIVNLEENERCFKILHTSYDQLPVHLKACFLYMGVFPEDHEITVSELIGMWVAESFIKPINGKGLEESGEEYLMDLVGRNLIMVRENNFFSEKVCNIHDLLSDLCIREARKEKFICVANQHNEGVYIQRRVAIHQDTSKMECLESFEGGSTTRSLMCYSRDVALPLAELRLLRLFRRVDAIDEKDIRNQKLEDICRLVNMRYISLQYHCRTLEFPSSLSLLWNLQALYVSGLVHVVAPPEIWKMPLIRRIESKGLILPDPPIGHTDGQDDFVLHELHTLLGIINLKLGEEVIKRISNVKRLRLNFNSRYKMPLIGLNTLDRLYKLEDLSLTLNPLQPLSRVELLQNVCFPHSLKKLSLCRTWLHWEDISTKIGSLPCLQMLILDTYSFIGPEWETVEGQFCSLKYLKIESCGGLKYWITESTHFPCLECLHLVSLLKLVEIPLCIGDIPTLKSIIVEWCSDSAVISAERILNEQEELGNQSLQVKLK